MSKLLSKLNSNTRISDNIEAIMAELHKLQQEITEVRHATKEGEIELQEIMKQIADGRGRALFYPYVGSGVGRGPYAELMDGSIKMDLINGIGVNILGHSHPRLTEAMLRASMGDLVMQGNLQPNLEYHQMFHKLLAACGKDTRLKHAWLTTCGTMANESAVKICRQKKSPASKIVSFQAAFAGRSTLMAELTDNKAYKEGLPDYDDVLRIPFFDPDKPNSSEITKAAFAEHIANYPDQIAVFAFEPIQGEGGFNVAPKEFFLPLFDLCKQHNIAIWADEVQTFCRTGEFLAIQKLGIGEYVDVVTVAKSLQAAATLYTEEFNPKPGLIAGTFAGATASLAAGNAVLDELSSGGYMGPGGKIEWIHQCFRSKLETLMQTTLKGRLTQVSGMGLMIALTCFDGSKERLAEVLNALFRNGIVAFGCGRGPFKVRFLVPAIMEEKDIQHAVDIIEKTLLEFEL